MTHPMDMSLSLTGWSVDPELLEEVAIELLHSEHGDDAMVRLRFKSGRLAQIPIEVAPGAGQRVWSAIQDEIAIPTKKVIEHGER